MGAGLATAGRSTTGLGATLEAEGFGAAAPADADGNDDEGFAAAAAGAAVGFFTATPGRNGALPRFGGGGGGGGGISFVNLFLDFLLWFVFPLLF